MSLSILYRGALSSCNYGCEYCPFAKHNETKEEHAHDAAQLSRFVEWVTRSKRKLSILFTPWGEALIRHRYQNALVELSNCDTVERVTIQTNLSCRLDWVKMCDNSRLALWATFHPTETTLERFLSKCTQLIEANVRFSVGVVGLKEHFDEIRALRNQLPGQVYMWINAYKRVADYYSPDDVSVLSAVDPLFSINNTYHESFGKACRAGSSVISVDGEGTVRRCHFIASEISNIYTDDLEAALKDSPCSNNVCGCHIGYVHMDDLGLYEVFQDGILERIPAGWGQPNFWQNQDLPA
ncbi:MAG: STM4011 family radical SAM protein [Candidatus Obscuribacterales bacterium]|nr:STM4011 family radical SAM protein [Candidatus Obscuribacterales bacterium]